MTTNITQPLPSLHKLIKATGLALIVAGVILITIVLPAEFGIDPTGIGKALGLTALNDNSRQIQPVTLAIEEAVFIPSNTTAVEPVEQLLTSTVVKSGAPFRSDEMTITLQEDEGSEIKALMKKGEQFVFTWTTDGGKVNFDMHGEQPNAGEAFTSYWKDKNQTNANGTFVAPFDGTHGWYWRNRGDKPVTIKVKVSGFYNKLYQPE